MFASIQPLDRHPGALVKTAPERGLAISMLAQTKKKSRFLVNFSGSYNEGAGRLQTILEVS
jgi:hypothetical protein